MTAAGIPKAYSLWIYDRHCTLIYHHDWSLPPNPSSLLAPGPDLLPGVTRCVQPLTQQQQQQQQLQPASQQPQATSSSHRLPLTEHAKLIYGLVFSLRNMTSKLSTSPTASSGQMSQFNTYTTPTYSFAHVQTPSMYTFVLLTDPIQPPSRRLPRAGSSAHDGGTSAPSSSSTTTSATGAAGGGGGGGIPGTGGMSLPGVIKQLIAGPWVDWVVKNPGMANGGLEWEDMEDEEVADDLTAGGRGDGDGDGNEDQVTDEGLEDFDGVKVRGVVKRASRLRGVDSEGLRRGIEAVLVQNKLSVNFGHRPI